MSSKSPQIPPNPPLQCGLPHLAIWICCRLCKSSPHLFQGVFLHSVKWFSPLWQSCSPRGVGIARWTQNPFWQLLRNVALYFVSLMWWAEVLSPEGSWPWGFSKGHWDNCDPSRTSQKRLSKKSSATSFSIPFPSYSSLFSGIASSFTKEFLPGLSQRFLGRECHLNKSWNKSCLLHLQGWWKL